MKQKVKNAEAVSLGKLRWKGKSKAEKSEHGKMMITKRWQKIKAEFEKKYPVQK